MKKVLIVMLALIMALTTVFASVSTVSAAPNKLQVEITNLTTGSISYDYAWKHLNVTSWLVEISQVPIGSTDVVKLYEKRFFATDFFSDKITVESSGLQAHVDDRIVSGYTYYVEVLLYGKDGRFLVGETAVLALPSSP